MLLKNQFSLRQWCFLIAPLLIMPMQARATLLEQFINEAISTHPTIQLRLAEEKVAHTDVDVARWQYYPTPSISVDQASVSATDSSYVGDDMVTIFQLSQPLWTGGKLKGGLDRAEAGVKVAVASIESEQQSIALQVVESYGDWFGAILQRQAWEKSLVTHRRLLKQVERRVDEGVSPNSELLLARGRLDSTLASISTVQAQEAVALSKLEKLVGHKLPNISSTEVAVEPHVIIGNILELETRALRYSPAIKRSLASKEIVHAQVLEAKANLRPNLSLRAEIQDGHFTIANTGTEKRIFIGFNSQFGAGLSSLSNLKSTQQKIAAAEEDIKIQRRAVSEQVLADHALMRSFETRVATLKSSLKTAVDVSDSYARQFLAGRKNWQDVLNAARDQVNTEIQLADALAAQMAVTWRLFVITEDTSSLINQWKDVS